MEEIMIKKGCDHIKLGQALKAAGLVESGAEAKLAVMDGQVTVNSSVCIQRGKKLYGGEVIEYNGEQIKIVC